MERIGGVAAWPPKKTLARKNPLKNGGNATIYSPML
jgi:hypothetical protein